MKADLSKIRAREDWLYFAVPPIATITSFALALLINDPDNFLDNIGFIIMFAAIVGTLLVCPVMIIIGSPIISALESVRFNGLIPYALAAFLAGYAISYPVGPLMVSPGEEPEDYTRLGTMVGVACGLGAYFINHYPERITLFRHARAGGHP